MWRIILIISLLGCSSEATVTCRDNNDGEVDWYILYKAPESKAKGLTGLEYLYIDSSSVTVTEMKPTAVKDKPINHPRGVLANTLGPLFTPIRSMPQNFGFISYSDQPPGCSAQQDFGHSKGVLMVDRTGTGETDRTGVWLLHSTPRFPFRRNQNTFWPDTGTKFAQIFICVTFPYAQFSHIGKHLQYIKAFPFEHHIPADFHQELKDAVNWTKDDLPKNFPAQSLTSKGKQAFRSITKQTSKEGKAEDGDLYVTIAGEFNSDLDVQMWGRQSNRACSYCPPNGPQVMNIKALSTDLGTWGPGSDHSKWCVAKDQNKQWTCFADMNRAKSQYERPGGALCIESKKVKKVFMKFVGGYEDCPSQNNMDTSNTKCVPDSYLNTNIGLSKQAKRPRLASGSS